MLQQLEISLHLLERIFLPVLIIILNNISLDENQIQTFLIAAQSEQPEFLPLYQVAITTGMRLGELLGLSWDDLDWDKHTLTINRQLTMIRGEGLVLTPPKSRAGQRTIELGTSTWSILKEHRKSQYKTQSCRDPDWHFLSPFR